MAKKKAEPKKTPNKVYTETRKLKCNLTNEEVLAHANSLAETIDDIAKLDDELKTMKEQMKAKITEKNAVVRVKQLLIRNKYELRDVECEVTMNWTTLKVTVKRLDSGEVVEERDMNYEEKQMSFSFTDDDKKTDTKKEAKGKTA